MLVLVFLLTLLMLVETFVKILSLEEDMKTFVKIITLDEIFSLDINHNYL